MLANTTMATKMEAFSQIIRFADLFGRDIDEFHIDDEYDGSDVHRKEDPPEAMVVQPILSGLDKNDSVVVGHFVAIISWETFFSGILSKETGIELHCVVSDSCGLTFTFELKGDLVTFIGDGDFHDDSGLQKSVTFQQHSDEGSHACGMKLTIYPTAEMVENYRTSNSVRLLVLVIFLSIATAAAIVTHNKGGEQRYMVMQAKAQRNNALLASLFPEKVRENLFDLDGGFKEESLQSLGRDGAQQGLAGILAKEKGLDYADPFDCEKVANLFLETTVLFADISGYEVQTSSSVPDR
jgi:hypothetical protein